MIRGCVPKKLLVYASEVRRTLEDARGNGWTIEGATHDWPTLIAAKDREITRLSSAYAERLRKAGAEVIEGHAVLVDPHTIEVGGRRITAANILVATGAAPGAPVAAGSRPTRRSTCPRCRGESRSWAGATSPWSSRTSSRASVLR